MDRHPPGRFRPPGVSPSATGPQQPDGGSGGDAEVSIPESPEAPALSPESERGLSATQHLCSRQWYVLLKLL